MQTADGWRALMLAQCNERERTSRAAGRGAVICSPSAANKYTFACDKNITSNHLALIYTTHLKKEYPIIRCLSALGSLKSCTVSLRTSGLCARHQSVCSRVSTIFHVLWRLGRDRAAGPGIISLLVSQLDIVQVGYRALLD